MVDPYEESAVWREMGRLRALVEVLSLDLESVRERLRALEPCRSPKHSIESREHHWTEADGETSCGDCGAKKP